MSSNNESRGDDMSSDEVLEFSYFLDSIQSSDVPLYREHTHSMAPYQLELGTILGLIVKAGFAYRMAADESDNTPYIHLLNSAADQLLYRLTDLPPLVQDRPDPAPTTPHEVAKALCETLRERGETYGDDYALPGRILGAIIPTDPYPGPTTVIYYSMIAVKLARLQTSRCTHSDSARDLAGYAALLEAHINRGKATK